LKKRGLLFWQIVTTILTLLTYFVAHTFMTPFEAAIIALAAMVLVSLFVGYKISVIIANSNRQTKLTMISRLGLQASAIYALVIGLEKGLTPITVVPAIIYCAITSVPLVLWRTVNLLQKREHEPSRAKQTPRSRLSCLATDEQGAHYSIASEPE